MPDDLDQSSPDESETSFTCPHCQHTVQVTPADDPQDIQCPNCGGLLRIPDRCGNAQMSEESSDAPIFRRPDRDDELDGLKVRNLTVARRALVRARTYALVATAGCAFAIVESIRSAGHLVRLHGWTLRSAGYVIVAVLLFGGLVYFARRTWRFTVELRRPHTPDPDLPPPDFTTLSDGSQYSKNLDAMNTDHTDE